MNWVLDGVPNEHVFKPYFLRILLFVRHGGCWWGGMYLACQPQSSFRAEPVDVG